MRICAIVAEVLLWIMLAVSIGFLSLSPSQAIAPAIQLVGTALVGHLLGYAVLGFWTFHVFGRLFPLFFQNTVRRIGLTVLVCLAAGGILELIQPFFGRTYSPADILANIAGGTAGALLGYFLLTSPLGPVLFHNAEKRARDDQ